jgi:uncharacterized protein YlxW (UPF0749 family)
MGLLDYLTVHSLDEDYAHVAARKGTVASRTGRTRLPTRATWVVLALFGLLVATAGVETARTAGVQKTSRASLVGQVNAGRAELTGVRDRLSALRHDIRSDQQRLQRVDGEQRATDRRVQRLGTASGFAPVRGQGVRLTVDDAPGATDESHLVLDKDLQNIVNGLWEAGARAVAVNGHRVTGLSAIREAGRAITLNYNSLDRPYVITAVGDPDQLPARFLDSTGGSLWLSTRNQYGLRSDMVADDDLRLPGARLPTLRHAAVPEEGS